jgi:acyl carrier protein
LPLVFPGDCEYEPLGAAFTGWSRIGFAGFSSLPASIMTKDEIASVLRELLRQQKQIKVEINSITPESRFDHLGFDSLSILDFMYDVENRFGVIPEAAELVRMQRVSELIDYLHRNGKT